jgi:hypothetical protein
MTMKLPLKPDPEEVWHLFRAGHDTYDIARMLVSTEPAVMRALIEAREAHYYAKDNPAVPSQRQSPLED